MEAGQRLLRELLRMYATGAKMTATAMCGLAHAASTAGASGPVSEWGLPPGQSTGNYQRLIDRMTKQQLCGGALPCMTLTAPGHLGPFKPRRSIALPVRAFHESLQAEVLRTPLAKRELAWRLAHKTMPPVWHSHPIVMHAPRGELVIPIALYMDGVQYGGSAGAGRKRSFIVLSIVNLLTGKRHVGVLLRKRICCKCGCRGWCTVYRAFAFAHWCFRALADGCSPIADLDGRAWTDGARASSAGQPLGFRAAVLYVMTDWEAVCSLLSVPVWSHVVHPCPLCDADTDRLHLYASLTSLRPPWRDHEHGAHEAACQRCEFWVSINTQTQLQRLLQTGGFTFDKRKKSGRGLCVTRDVPALNAASAPLKAGDLLPPQAALPDVFGYADVQLPTRWCFWRESCETLTTRRNPLFDATLGLTVSSYAVDELHTNALGVFGFVAVVVMQRVVRSPRWSHCGADAHSSQEIAVQHMNTVLHKWYEEERRRGAAHAEIDMLTPGMLGTEQRPVLKAKGGEAMALFKFCCQRLLPDYRDALHKGIELHACANALLQWHDVLCAQPDVVPNDACSHLCHLCVRHLVLLGPAGIPFKPKHHLFVHMNFRTV